MWNLLINPFYLIDKLAVWWIEYRTQAAVVRRMVEQGVNKDFAITYFKQNIETGNFEMKANHPIVSAIASECSKLLTERSAKNFVVLDLYPRADLWDEGVRPVRLTIQWAYGLNPGEKAQILTNLLTTAEQDIKLAKPRTFAMFS